MTERDVLIKEIAELSQSLRTAVSRIEGVVKERDELAACLKFLKRFDDSMILPPAIEAILAKYLEAS